MEALKFKTVGRLSIHILKLKATMCFLVIMLICIGRPNDLDPTSGEIQCGDETYSISIGEVSKTLGDGEKKPECEY